MKITKRKTLDNKVLIKINYILQKMNYNGEFEDYMAFVKKRNALKEARLEDAHGSRPIRVIEIKTQKSIYNGGKWR